MDNADLIREAIEKANRHLETVVQQGDARRLATLYSEDAVLLPAGFEPVQGRAAIADFWQIVLQMGVKEIQIETREVDPQGATAIEVGEFTLRGANARFIDRGKYIVIWKLIQGEWKLHRDIWNSSIGQQ